MSPMRYGNLRRAVIRWLDEEHTRHLDKDGCLRKLTLVGIDDGTHPNNPDDCPQCQVELELF